ncbi:MAG: outer-membrane lipoprotein carrier protein LolA [bacterium]|nr:outer-membrane lipoprotein carrier protein LolA [bacterium]
MKKIFFTLLILISFITAVFCGDADANPKPEIDKIFKEKTLDMEDLDEAEKNIFVANVKQFYKDMKTFQGKFKEEIFLSFIDQTQFLKGNFIFKKEQLFRLETEESDLQVIVSDGEILWTHLIDEGICYKRAIEKAEDISALFEILPIGEFDTNFNITAAKNRTFYLLELKIKEDAQVKISYEKIIYILNRETLHPEIVYLWTKDGRVLKLIFSETQIDKELDDSYFKFVVPEKVEVIEY